jgi:hypothetical protein
MNQIIKLIQSNDFVKIALILLGVYLFMTYTQKDTMNNVEPGIYEPLDNVEQSEVVQGQAPPQQSEVVQGDVEGVAVSGFESKKKTAVEQTLLTGKDQLKADDLLPKYDEANEFAKQNPVSNLLKEQNFLISGYHVGINTVMQSNKIPYHDIRSAPPIPKENVGPWSQSSYDTPAGANRRMLEIL